MKILFFGYLSRKARIVSRISSTILCVFFPFMYYKQYDGVLIEDVLGKFIYSFETIDLILIFTGPVTTIISSFVIYKLYHHKNEQ